MTQYRHDACGSFVEEHFHRPGSPYYLCRGCLCTVGPEHVTAMIDSEPSDEDRVSGET